MHKSTLQNPQNTFLSPLNENAENDLLKKLSLMSHANKPVVLSTFDQFSGPFHQNEKTSPNEQIVYCICSKPEVRGVDMIVCYNPQCEYKRFYIECISLKRAIKGKWFCKFCKTTVSKKCV